MPNADFSHANILIVKLSAIGDVIHALPVASALKRCFPEARISWVVEKPAYDLLTNNPDIDEIIIFDKPRYKSLANVWQNGPEFVRLLKSHSFDLALDLQALFKSAAIVYLSGAPKRLVYCNTRELSGFISDRICGENANGHVVERYLDVVRAIGCKAEKAIFRIEITEGEATLAEGIAGEAGLASGMKYAVFAPGANWPNKRWPSKCFAALADRLGDIDLIPVIVGGPGDSALAEEIKGLTNVKAIDLIGKTTLKQLAHIVKGGRVFVGGDTGPMHLAAALATPVVALFGPTDPKRNGPYGQGNIVLKTAHSCTGCWKRKCPKGEDCLSNLSPDAVYQAVLGLLNAERNGRANDSCGCHYREK